MNRGLRIGSGPSLGGLGAFGIKGGGTRPSVVITSSESSPSYAYPIPLTITFSEAVTGFAVGDLTLGNCTAANFAGSGASYTVDILRTATAVTVDIAASVCVSAATGLGNKAATQFAITSGLLLWDGFTTTEAAPMATPRTPDVYAGGNTWAVDDECSIASGEIQITDTSNNKGIISSSTIARAAGLAIYVKVGSTKATDVGFGWCSSLTSRAGYFSGVGAATITSLAGEFPIVVNITTALTTGSDAFVIRRGTGVYFVVDGVLMYVDYSTNTNNLKAAAIAGTATQSGKFANYKVVQLPAPWSTETIYTNSIASPAINEITTMVANGHVEFTWTAVTNETCDLMIRRTDDDNCWIVRADQAGSTIKLFEKNAGVETERATAAQTFTNGVAYHIYVMATGNTIRYNVNNTNKNVYASATFNNTATGVKVTKAGANLVTYPYVLSGAALQALQAVY